MTFGMVARVMGFPSISLPSVGNGPTAQGALPGRKVSVFGAADYIGLSMLTAGVAALVVSGYVDKKHQAKLLIGGALLTVSGTATEGYILYYAKLAQSLALSIEQLKGTQKELDAQVGVIKKQVDEFSEQVKSLTTQRDQIQIEVDSLKTQNDRLEKSNNNLDSQIKQRGAQLSDLHGQVDKQKKIHDQNKELLEERGAQLKRVEEALTRFTKLQTTEKENLDRSKGELTAVSAKLESSLEAVAKARKELDERIPQMETSAIARIQAEGEKYRSELLDKLTKEMGQVHLDQEGAARDRAKEIRAEARQEAAGMREAAREGIDGERQSLREGTAKLAEERNSFHDIFRQKDLRIAELEQLLKRPTE